MKTVVFLQELVDAELRPGDLTDQFQRLTSEAVAALVAGALVEVNCPACGDRSSTPAFAKLGLAYRQCGACASVFASPRPQAAALAEYYQSSPPALFWRDRILPATREARTLKLAQPRAEWIADGVSEHCPKALSVVDVSSAGTPVIDALARLTPALRFSAADALSPGHYIGAEASVDVVVAFDVLDRIADVATFVDHVHRTLRPGGLLFLATPSISGFDLQALWDRSDAILPPDKLNLPSIAGLRRLFAAPRWEIIELSTPGMFDVENVRQAIMANPDADWPRAVREIVMQDDRARLELQAYLQRHLLASFARLIVRRR